MEKEVTILADPKETLAEEGQENGGKDNESYQFRSVEREVGF